MSFAFHHSPLERNFHCAFFWLSVRTGPSCSFEELYFVACRCCDPAARKGEARKWRCHSRYMLHTFVTPL